MLKEHAILDKMSQWDCQKLMRGAHFGELRELSLFITNPATSISFEIKNNGFALLGKPSTKLSSINIQLINTYTFV